MNDSISHVQPTQYEPSRIYNLQLLTHFHANGFFIMLYFFFCSQKKKYSEQKLMEWGEQISRSRVCVDSEYICVRRTRILILPISITVTVNKSVNKYCHFILLCFIYFFFCDSPSIGLSLWFFFCCHTCISMCARVFCDKYSVYIHWMVQ